MITPLERRLRIAATVIVSIAGLVGLAFLATYYYLKPTLPDVAVLRDVRLQDATCGLVASEIHLAIPALLDLLGDRRTRLAFLTTHSATLEDVFMALTGRHLRDA